MAKQFNRIYVLIKQVPNMRFKAGLKADGTIDRAAAKAMLNPFDGYALQAAVDLKRQTGAHVVAITMGPPRATQVLVEAMEHGADEGILLTDRRLAGSDTLATAYALSGCIKRLGVPDVVLCGLQTTDGDTAHVGPQTAERLDIPHITYVESLTLKDGQFYARRVIEGGHQDVVSSIPILMTVANAAKPLGRKRFGNVARVKQRLKGPEDDKGIRTLSLDDIDVDVGRTGIDGSPTVVSRTVKIGKKGGSCQMYTGSVTHTAKDCVGAIAGSDLAHVLRKSLK